MSKPIYQIDGNHFDDFAGFIVEMNRGYISHVGGNWEGNLDAFHDYFSWSDQPLVLRWRNSAKSQKDFGYEAMTDWLRGNLERCHPANRTSVEARLALAENRSGPTLFDWLVEIVRENEWNCELELC